MYRTIQGLLSALLVILVQPALACEAGDLFIENDTLWTSMLIGPGQSLQLHGQIRVADSVAITVLSGGSLLVDSARISALNTRWSGLRTYDDDASLSAPGLRLQRAHVSGADSVLKSRGRLKAGLRSVEFSDCGVLIDWQGPASGKPLKFEWISWREGRTGFREMGFLRGVPGLEITGSEFEGLDCQLGWAVRDAGFLMHDSLARNIMAGWSLAVDLSSIYGLMPSAVRIAGTDFEGPRAIRLHGLSLLEVSGNSFNIESMPALGDTLYALYMETVSDVLVKDNLVLGEGMGFGFIVANCGERSNLLLQNQVRQTGTAVAVVNRNGGRRHGLVLRCNDWRQNENSVWVSGPDENGAILGWQGHCPGFPASNRFDRAWRLDGLVAPIHYWEVAGALEDSLFAGLRYQECLVPPDSVCPDWSYLSAEDQAQRLLSHELLLDNGDTEGLLTLVQNPATPRGVMEFVLSEANPYLSDTVLIALLDRIPEVVPDFLEFILLSNSPLSSAVLESASEVLPVSDFELLMTAQDGLSARQFLESQLALWETQWSETISSSWYEAFEQSDSSAFQLYCESRPDLCLAFQVSRSLVGAVSDTSTLLGWIASNCDPAGCRSPEPDDLPSLEALASGSGWFSAMAGNILRQWSERWEPREQIPASSDFPVEASFEWKMALDGAEPESIGSLESDQPCTICFDPSGKAYHRFLNGTENADRRFRMQQMGWICKPCR